MNIKTHLGRIQITLPILAVVSNIFLIFIATISLIFARQENFHYSYFKFNFVYLFFFLSFLTFFFTTLLLNFTALIKQNYSAANLFILLILDLLLVFFLLAFTLITSFYQVHSLKLIPLTVFLPISILAIFFNLMHLALVSIHFSSDLAANKN